jgi:A/G-specific adenine glycosylase
MARLKWEPEKIVVLRRQLLKWYARNRRDLPWRRSRDPYAIWVSEIMLQQTRVAVVIERYQAFMERFPTLLSLALASEQEVLALWSGLGYYSRARNLHRAAQFMAERHRGNLPATAEELRTLPGIGAYTAAAIASIAQGERAAVVDGNVERVLCRMAGWKAGNGGAALKHKIENLAAQLIDPEQPGDFNQALMELGATLCLPRNPQCLVCPVSADCMTRGEHKTLPRLRMLSKEVAHAHELRMTVRHAIMQVNYYVRIRTVFEDDVEAMTVPGGERRWVPLGVAAGMALTGLTRKVLARAHLLPTASLDAIAPQPDGDVL